MEGGGQEAAAGVRKRSGGHSGRLLLRMPEALHADLARAAQREGMSLNAYITDVLAKTVGGKTPPAARGDAPARRPLLERLLLVNVIVLAAVGVLVVVLLVQALR
jgi:hypothetical protein